PSQRVSVNDGNIFLETQAGDEIERQDISSHRNELAFALGGDAEDGDEGMEPFDAIAGGLQGIFGDLPLERGAVHDRRDAMFTQSVEQPLNGGLGSAPLVRVVFSEQMNGAHDQ